jgi:hypothetical protein
MSIININPERLRVDGTAGFVLTLNGQEEIKPKKSKYNEALKNQIKEVCRFNALDNMYSENLGRRLNANESTFLKESLTRMIAEAMETWYPDNTARLIFPMSSQNLPGVQSLKYALKEWSGKAMIVTDDATDMPMVARKASPYYSPVYEFQLGAVYTQNDLEAAALMGQPLDNELIMDTRKGQERALNDAVFGIAEADDPNTANYPGLFNQPTRCILSGDDADLTNHNILSGSAADNLAFLQKVINVPHNYTSKAEAIPDTLVMPIAQVNKIKVQKTASDNPLTVAQEILTNASIKRIIASPECKNVGLNSITDACFVFNSSEQSKICEIQETLPYRVGLPQMRGYSFLIPTRSRSAGLFVYRKAIALVKNVGA